MKCLIFSASLCIACILFSEYANAVVTHPENSNIVGKVFHDRVCFNNDGALENETECDGSGNDGGVVELSGGDWQGDQYSGINGCGTDAVTPVSSATCPLTYSDFGRCALNGYVLVKTLWSGYFWAVRGDPEFCTLIAEPETIGLFPCLSTDAFDPVNGCTPFNDQTAIGVKGGYIQLETSDGRAPPASHCTDSTHHGRMVIDSALSRLYICTEAGWEPISTDIP